MTKALGNVAIGEATYNQCMNLQDQFDRETDSSQALNVYSKVNHWARSSVGRLLGAHNLMKRHPRHGLVFKTRLLRPQIVVKDHFERYMRPYHVSSTTLVKCKSVACPIGPLPKVGSSAP
jgi:hypothetical protein